MSELVAGLCFFAHHCRISTLPEPNAAQLRSAFANGRMLEFFPVNAAFLGCPPVLQAQRPLLIYAATPLQGL
jgi:hypothetical protein